MPLERRLSRVMFGPQETVALRQICFTPGKLFQPGRYQADQLPDVAFEMGLVERLSAAQVAASEPPLEIPDEPAL